ncbi:hypothetical protein NE852_16640 [Rhizobium sp. Pop5]|uniref:hypothetical protein n=1 Tax=Rhizobium sp. Pop5 TaxID=1223565 RepID=UPI001FD923B7|nr:hypothetical protein [Rhizobium sp. Pop5]UVD55709.1 hypothetical protein NE852_16640 [Rhizobium sp. Pop5]
MHDSIECDCDLVRDFLLVLVKDDRLLVREVIEDCVVGVLLGVTDVDSIRDPEVSARIEISGCGPQICAFLLPF